MSDKEQAAFSSDFEIKCKWYASMLLVVFWNTKIKKWRDSWRRK
jgi:hypothetical protein